MVLCKYVVHALISPWYVLYHKNERGRDQRVIDPKRKLNGDKPPEVIRHLDRRDRREPRESATRLT